MIPSRTLRIVPAILAFALAAAASSCGGGSGGTSVQTISGSPDATILGDGTVITSGATAIRVGDTSANLGQRGALRFGLFFLSNTSTIISARLHLNQVSVVGAPYGGGALGSVTVDHCAFGFSVDNSDYTDPPLSNIGVISPDATLGVKELDVTAALIDDVANLRFNSDYLLRFTVGETNGNNVEDAAVFDDQENDLASGDAATLIVTYTN